MEGSSKILNRKWGIWFAGKANSFRKSLGLNYNVEHLQTFVDLVVENIKMELKMSEDSHESSIIKTFLDGISNEAEYVNCRKQLLIPSLVKAIGSGDWKDNSEKVSQIANSFIKWNKVERTIPNLRGVFSLEDNYHKRSWVEANLKFKSLGRIPPPAFQDVKGYLDYQRLLVDLEFAALLQRCNESKISCSIQLDSPREGTVSGGLLNSWYQQYKITEGDQLIVTMPGFGEIKASIRRITVLMTGEVSFSVYGHQRNCWLRRRDGESTKMLEAEIQLAANEKEVNDFKASAEFIEQQQKNKEPFPSSWAQVILYYSFKLIVQQAIVSFILIGETGALADKVHRYSLAISDTVVTMKQDDKLQSTVLTECCNKPFFAIQGPPGTGTLLFQSNVLIFAGKTSIIISLISSLFLLGVKRILFVSETNRCVNDLLVKLKQRSNLPEGYYHFGLITDL